MVVNDAYGEGCWWPGLAGRRWPPSTERCDVLVLMLGDQPGVGGRTPWLRCWPAAARRRLPEAAAASPRPPDRVRPLACSASSPTCTATRACGGCSTSARRRRRRGARSRARSRATSTPRRTTERSRAARSRMNERRRIASPTSRRSPSGWPRVDYLADEGLATSMFLSLRLPTAAAARGPGGRRQDRGRQFLASVLETPDPPPVLRGARRRRGPVRVELPEAAPASSSWYEGARRLRSDEEEHEILRASLPAQATAAAGFRSRR